jgi:hypothetical protein
MGLPRNLAARLLRALLRYAPPERRAWAEAMLREMEFIEPEWDALFWALGCTTVIFRECLGELALWIRTQLAQFFGFRQIEEENNMNATGKKTLGFLSGMGIALALGVVAYLLRYVIADILKAFGIPPTMWSHILSVMLPTEIIVIGAAIVLWQRKRVAVAVGLLVPAVVMGGHVVLFLANR